MNTLNSASEKGFEREIPRVLKEFDQELAELDRTTVNLRERLDIIIAEGSSGAMVEIEKEEYKSELAKKIHVNILQMRNFRGILEYILESMQL